MARPGSRGGNRGRPQKVDQDNRPTPERLRHVESNDPVLWAVNTLDRSKNPMMTSGQEWVVERFGRLWRSYVEMNPHSKSALDKEHGRGLSGADEEKHASARRKYLVAANALASRSRDHLDVMINVSVYRRWPRRKAGKFWEGVGILEALWVRRKAA